MTTPEKNTQDSVPGNALGQDPNGRPLSGDMAFERRAQELFREASERIDHFTAGQLRAARRTALDAGRSPQPHTARWLLPAGAFAAIALATLMVWQPLSPSPGATMPAGSNAVQTAEIDNDLPPDAEKTDPNLYQNMDFYKWLAANNVSDDAAGGQPVNR